MLNEIENLLLICEDTTEFSFKDLNGDTLKEKFHSLHVKLTEKSTDIYHKTGEKSNLILTSPELACWFKTCATEFVSSHSEKEELETKYCGVISCWCLYATPLLSDKIIIGIKNDNGSKTMASFIIKDWIE